MPDKPTADSPRPRRRAQRRPRRDQSEAAPATSQESPAEEATVPPEEASADEARATPEVAPETTQAWPTQAWPIEDALSASGREEPAGTPTFAAPIDENRYVPTPPPPPFEPRLPLVGPDDRADDEEDVEPVELTPVDEDPAPVIPALEAWLPLLEDRSPNPEVCPFFRAVVADSKLGPPIGSPHPANRCAALRQAAPQSLRQQQLVCLTSGHINCPRYLRGALVIGEPSPSAAAARPSSGPTPATLSALVALVLAFSASVAFVLAKGGLTLQAAAVASGAPSAPAIALVSPSPTPAPLPSPTAAPAISASPAVSPSSSPIASASVAPSPTPTAAATATPRPTSNRFALLTACPNKPNCYIYRIRSGDNLFSIAHYFGVPIETVRRLNPWTRTQALRAGRELTLPPPTR